MYAKGALVLLFVLGSASAQAAKRPVAVVGHPTAAECAQIRSAVESYGMPAVLIGARLRGYTDAQTHFARRRCKV